MWSAGGGCRSPHLGEQAAYRCFTFPLPDIRVVAHITVPSIPDCPLHAGSEEVEDEGDGLLLAVLEDTGNKADVKVTQHDPAVAVREAVSKLLRHQSQGSPLWTAYASYEALTGSIKVRS